MFSRINIFLISIRFIFVAIKGDKSKDRTTYLIQRTEHGEINISSDTIVGLVQLLSILMVLEI